MNKVKLETVNPLVATKRSFTEAVPYLEASRVSGNNIISLSSYLAVTNNSVYSLAAKGYKYFKVNSVAYPIWDNNQKLFLDAGVYYQVLNNNISFSFFPITYGAYNNVIYADNGSTLDSTDQTYMLYITLSDTPDPEKDVYKQTLRIASSDAGATYTSFFVGSFVKKMQYTAKSPSTAASINIAPLTIQFSPSSKIFTLGGADLVQDTIVAERNVIAIKSENKVVGSFIYTNTTTDNRRAFHLPIEAGNIVGVNQVDFTIYE